MSHSASPENMLESAVEKGEEPTKLILAYEKLYEIPKAVVSRFSDHIQYLDISHNKITNLDVLVNFKNLTSLIADGNPITENCYLPQLPKLDILWLNRCNISSIYPWVGNLRESCPNITYLSLMGNPAAPSYLNGGTFYEYLQYRLFVISHFPSLTHLDDRKVTEDQRTESERLYKRPLLERLVNPKTGSIPQLMIKSVTWSAVHDKLNAILGKNKREQRNLFI